jgi:peptide/nickel transport system permease protein
MSKKAVRAGIVGAEARAIGRRLCLAVPLLFVVSALSFVLLSLAPGDAPETILGTSATPDQYAHLRHELGLDQPLYVQYWHWLRHAVTGDLGGSLFTNEPVTHAIGSRLPVSLSLILCSLVLMLVVGVGLGVLSAVRGGVIGQFVDALSLAGFALPGFWIAAMLIEVFAVRLRWLPAIGYVSLSQSPVDWLRSLALPVTALALPGVAGLAKNTRDAMLDVLSTEHVRMAWANGVSARSIVFIYALKNAAIRIVTILGLMTVGLLGGTVLIETVFALPGLGGLLVNSTVRHDVPVVQGVAIFFTAAIVIINLVTDVLYRLLDPRIRVR